MSRTEGSPFSRDDYYLAEDMFREAVQANVAEEDNLEAIRAAFEERVNAAFERGEFIVEVKRLTVDHMWARVNGRAGMNTLAVVKEIVSGQTSLDMDAWLDQIVTVGKHRRSAVRDLSKTDWDRIVAVRQENADRAAEALDMAKQAARISTTAMAQYGDMTGAAPHLISSDTTETQATA